MDHKLRRQLEPWSNFRLARLAPVQGNAGPQEFGTRRPVDGAIDSAAPKEGAVRRINDSVDFQFRDIALDNFDFNHICLHYNIYSVLPKNNARFSGTMQNLFVYSCKGNS
jgi:hypothetical protein